MGEEVEGKYDLGEVIEVIMGVVEERVGECGWYEDGEEGVEEEGLECVLVDFGVVVLGV